MRWRWWWRSQTLQRRIGIFVGVVILPGIVLVAILSLVPFSHPLASGVVTTGEGACTSLWSYLYGVDVLHLTVGSSVNVVWQDVGGHWLQFSVFEKGLDCDNDGNGYHGLFVCPIATAVSGTCSFGVPSTDYYTMLIVDTSVTEGTQNATYSVTAYATIL